MVDANPERPPISETDFLHTAEEAAMSKLADIHNRRFYKHSFARFALNDKGVNLDRLSQSLKFGLLSEDLAKKIGLPYPRNFQSVQINKNDDTDISLSTPNATIPYSISWAVAAELAERRKLSKDDLYIILIDPDIVVRTYTASIESRKKRSISPRKFSGIVIVGNQTLTLTHQLDNPINYSPGNTEKTVEDIASLMLATYKKHPELVLPIYDISGALLWPKKLSYEEVQRAAKK